MDHKTVEFLISCFSFGLIIPVGLGLFFLALWVDDVTYFSAVYPVVLLKALLAENYVIGFGSGILFVVVAAFTSEILRTKFLLGKKAKNYEEKKRGK